MKSALIHLSLFIATATAPLSWASDFQPSAKRVGDFESVVLTMQGEEFGARGGQINSTLHLKKQINQQTRGLQLKNYNLVSVTVLGKSTAVTHSNSIVTLYIKGRYMDQGVLDSSGRGGNGSDSVVLQAKQGFQYDLENDAWHLDFSARTKVHRVIVILKRVLPARLKMKAIAVEKAPKLIVLPETFAVQQAVDTIQIKSVLRTVDIESVEVFFGNGDSRFLQMHGRLREGQRMRENLANVRNISHIVVRSTSPELTGSQGRYELSVGSAQ